MGPTVYKKRQKRNYLYRDLAIFDTSATSPLYFNVLEIPQVFTAGKNVVKVGINGPFLKQGSEFDLEVLDFEGNPLYVEFSGFVDRYNYSYFTVYVYDINKQGAGTITLVGEAKTTPEGYPITLGASQHVKEFNVKWVKNVSIKPLERNTSDILFYKSPVVNVSQVLTPYRFNLGTYSINKDLYTQSLAGLEIISTTNRGVDFSINKSKDVQDLESLNNTYNYFQKSSTATSIKSNLRKRNGEVESGYVYSEYTRFNTLLYDSQSRLSKDMEGSTFAFDDQDSGHSIIHQLQYYPYTASSIIQIKGESGSLPSQFTAYRPKIVSVLNSQYAILDSPPTVRVFDSSSRSQPIETDFIFSKISHVTGAFAYPTSSNDVIESINLSSSYIQFTITDFNPIAGDVYRLKTYVKEAGQSTEYYQLNDHIVQPPEYLIDSDKPNQAVYTKNKSDFFTYGEFTDPTIPANYWRGFVVDVGGEIQQYSFNLSASISQHPLANSMRVYSSGSVRRGFASRYYQTFIQDEPYSLSFYCTLEPGLELEVYMSSTPLKDTLSDITGPKAFYSTRNYAPDITGSISKFGKLVGKVSNYSGSATRTYDNVVFDFYPDEEGFGRPVFLLNVDPQKSGSAYISSISLTPLDLVGHTPSILQFAAAPPDSLWILYDDDAHMSQSIDVKIEYFTVDGKQSEFVTYIPNLQLNVVNEIPGFCAGATSRFNDHCPFYYEVGTGSLATTDKPNSGLVTLDPRLWTGSGTAFWPTFSVNSYDGFSWNIKAFTFSSSYAAVTYSIANSFITTSWFRYDPMLPLYDTVLPTITYQPFEVMYSVTGSITPYLPPTYSSTWIDEHSALPILPGRRPFYEADGAAISKYDIAKSQSLLLEYSNVAFIQTSASRLNNLQTYLKTTRLYYPATTGSFPYDFYENGAIYNVRFNIAQVPTLPSPLAYGDDGAVINNNLASEVATWSSLTIDDTKYQPDKIGAKLMVYIADVATPLYDSTVSGVPMIVPGTPGFFPPKNNIATITNGAPGGVPPAIRYYDSGSGYLIDTYDLLLVQYGEKAQLVFDACGLDFEIDSGSSYADIYPGSYKIYMTGSQGFWGGVISDIEWCKVGITTDPRYIKPINFNNELKTFIPYRLPTRFIPINPNISESVNVPPSWTLNVT